MTDDACGLDLYRKLITASSESSFEDAMWYFTSAFIKPKMITLPLPSAKSTLASSWVAHVVLDSYPPGPKFKKVGVQKRSPQNGGLKPPASRVISRNGRVVSRHVRELHVWFVVVRIGTDAVVRNEKKGLYTHEKFVHPWTCFVSVGLSSRKRACRRTVHAMTSEGAELAEWEGVRCDLSEYRKVLRINSRRTVRTMQIRVEER